MRNDKDQDLDRILKEWATAHAPKERDVESLEQQLLSRLLQRQPVDISPLISTEPVGHWRWRNVAILTATMAATVLVSLAVHKIVVRAPHDGAITATDAYPFAPALLTS